MSSASSPSTPHRHGVCIIGAGWGIRVQLRAFNASSIPVVALCGHREETTKKTAMDMGIPQWGTNIIELLDSNPDITMVSIVSPPSSHLHYVSTVLSYSKRAIHIISEKPFCMDVAEAKTMVSLSNKSLATNPRLICIVDHELRVLSLIQSTRRAMPRIGRINVMKCDFLSPLSTPATMNWWAKESEGGGMLGAVGTHMLDTILFLLGIYGNKGDGHNNSVFTVDEIAGTLDTTQRRKPNPTNTNQWEDATSDDHCQIKLHIKQRIELPKGDAKVNDQTGWGNQPGGESHVFPVDITLMVVSGPPKRHMYINGTHGTILIDVDALTSHLHHPTAPITAGSSGVEAKGVEVLSDKEEYNIDAIKGPPTAFTVGTAKLIPIMRQFIENGGVRKDWPDSFATFEESMGIMKMMELIKRSNKEGGKWIKMD